MANSAYKGLKIVYEADTTTAAKALRDIDKQATGTTADLRKLNNALKLDPGNTQLIAEKQEVLGRKIQAATDKLKLYREIEAKGKNQEGMTDQLWTQLQADIALTTKELEKYQLQAKQYDISKNLDAAKYSANEARKELEHLNKALELDPGNVDLVKNKQEALKRAIEATEQELKEYKTIYSSLDKQDLSDAEWAELKQNIKECESELKEYSHELDILNSKSVTAASKAGAAFTSAGETISNAGKKVSQVGDAYTRTITTGLVGASALAIKEFKDMDDALTEVRKTVDGSEEDYKKLREAAVEFSKTNTVSAEQMLEIEALGAQLGFSLDELQKFGEVASGLDIATNMSADQAASEMAHFSNIMGMAHDEIDRYASTIIGLGNTTATTEADISAMAQRIAGAGKSIGMSSADVLGLAAALSSLGIEAEAGGTAISTIMSEIDKAVATNSDDLTAWAEAAHMSAEEFSTAWKGDPVQALQLVLQGIQSNVEGGGNLTKILDDLGVDSIRQTDVMKRLANSGSLMADTVAKANDAWRDNTALTKEVANKNNALGAKFDMLKNRVMAIATKVGEPLANALLKFLDAAQPVFDKIEDLANAFANMDESQQKNIVSIGLQVAAFGPLLSIVGRLGTGLGGLTSGLGTALQAFAGMRKGALATEAEMTALTGLTSSLKAGLVGIGVAAAGVVAAFAIQKWTEWQETIRTTEKAHRSLADLEDEVAGRTAAAGGIIADAEGKLHTYGQTVWETADKIKELNKQAAESGDAFTDAMSDIDKNVLLSDAYAKTIEELSSKGQLTEKEMFLLKLAVDGYNQATGDNLQILDEQTGALSKSTDEINLNRKAWEENAKAQAYMKYAQDQLELMTKYEMELEQAKEAEAKAQEKLNSLDNDRGAHFQELVQQMGSAEAAQGAFNAEVQAAQDELKQAKDNVSELTGQIDTCSKNYEAAAAKGAEYTASIEAQKRAFETLAKTIVDAMGDSGVSVDEFKERLKKAGVSADNLADVSAEDFQRMWSECYGNVDLMIDKLVELDKQKIDEKKLEVDDHEVDDAFSKLRELAERARQNIVQRVQTIFSSSGSPFKVFGNAAGGHIPTHADGGSLNGILTTPTLTNVGWIGEAGAEAAYTDRWGSHIIPLTNDRYADIFAGKIAEHMIGGSSGGDTYITVDLRDAQLNNDKAIEDKTLDLLEEVARKGDMNRG